MGKKGWTFPGHRYTGPGNSIVNGKPTNYNDAVSRDHDLAYNVYGSKAYWQYSEADEIARSRWKWNEPGGAAGKAFFSAKKLAWQAGLIGDTGDLKKNSNTMKRLRGNRMDPLEPDKKKINKNDRSLVNLQTQLRSTNESARLMNGGDGDGSGTNNANGTLKETPVDNPHDVHRGPPDYTFSSLPFVQLIKVQEDQRFAVDLAWRMTSPYDPSVTVTSGLVAGTTGAPVYFPETAEPDSSIRAARWFRMYAGLYKYYHVVSCRYNIWIENLGGEPLYCHLMFYNEQLPPSGATNEDMMLWKDTRTQILAPAYKAVIGPGFVGSNETNQNTGVQDTNETDLGGTNNTYNYASTNHVTSRGGHTSCSFSGEYTPGDFKREVILDSQVENWTATTTNPVLPERLLLRLKPENPALHATNAVGDQVRFKLRCELNYLVEFKELQDGLRWPVSRQPVQIAIDQNIFSTAS